MNWASRRGNAGGGGGGAGEGGGDPNAGGNAEGGGGGGDGEGGGENEEGGGGGGADPCEILRKGAKDLGSTISAMEGHTLSEEDDDSIGEDFESLMDEAKELQQKFTDLADKHAEDHDDDEEEDDDASGGGDAEDEDEDEDDEGAE